MNNQDQKNKRIHEISMEINSLLDHYNNIPNDERGRKVIEIKIDDLVKEQDNLLDM